MTTHVPPAPPSVPCEVTTEEGTALYAMLSVLDAAEAEAKEAEARLKALKDGIKAELTAITTPAGTPHERYRVWANGMAPRVLRWTPSVRIDTPKLKAERPDIYAAYTKASGAWVLGKK